MNQTNRAGGRDMDDDATCHLAVRGAPAGKLLCLCGFDATGFPGGCFVASIVSEVNCSACLAEIDKQLDAAHHPKPTETAAAPIPILLKCPECGARHIDRGDFATKPHHTHACQSCGHCWRPAVVATVGVQFLPGFKDESVPATAEAIFTAVDRMSRPVGAGAVSRLQRMTRRAAAAAAKVGFQDLWEWLDDGIDLLHAMKAVRQGDEPFADSDEVAKRLGLPVAADDAAAETGISSVLDMTLRELMERFGSVEALTEWLNTQRIA